MGKGTPCQANSQVEAKLQAGSSKAEQAQSREVAVQVQAELSQCQQKQQLSLEQELKHVHPASHAQEKVQKSLEQLQALREQLRAREEENWSLWCGLAWLQEELRATRSQGQQSEEERQQLRWELRKLQEQSKQEELSRQAQHWQQLYQDSQRALAAREEELVLCKVELAFFKEELSKAKKQVPHRNGSAGWAPGTREGQSLAHRQGRSGEDRRGDSILQIPGHQGRTLRVWQQQG
ncbi:PREDICTED: putative uncharacterized protein DDB_G0271606 isoform X1 [Calidris pugnax]|uniref:putative uncharacterized protein DDB_G0271606 isoform X1 n=1 Tax=Calidris pugnax TaxID=198806 RepID=UPI00071D9E7E|nr:PREDICTED: putative uncharacterized protein DDB_G0271606 isoform X1 [Calidris pugnax]